MAQLGQKVEIYTSNGVILACYASAQQAARVTGMGQGAISSMCRGEGPEHVCGFQFRLADPRTPLNELPKLALENALRALLDANTDEDTFCKYFYTYIFAISTTNTNVFTHQFLSILFFNLIALMCRSLTVALSTPSERKRKLKAQIKQKTIDIPP